MESPADLCEKHWQDWFDYKLEVPSREELERTRIRPKRARPHGMIIHRQSESMLRELRNYYVRTGMKGKLSSIHILVEFIEAYAELKGWDLGDPPPIYDRASK